ncbi:MAG: HAMP domain-containing histidine kinase [Lachnospiraceae bacterium]|nr:HAMP domain-containing histidine kinase [Lachnospiraceae bacterium]
MNKPRSFSLKNQLAAAIIVILSVTITSLWFINVFFLERYYTQFKKENLQEFYVQMVQHARDGQLGSDVTKAELMRLCNIHNLEFLIVDSSANILYSSLNDPGRINRQLRDFIFARETGRGKILDENDEYTLELVTDDVESLNYLVMWGSLDAENFFMLRANVESIKDSVELANRFLLRVGIAAIVIASVVTWFMMGRITKPILELARISQKMAELNFEEKYKGHSKSEIGVLGENINLLSETLEKTIGDLKGANIELQKDVKAREEADQRRQEFLGAVSHELKTPIALIQGYAEGLKEGISEDKESRDYYCDVIIDETGKMNNLVLRLISLNQVESGNEITNMERFDLCALVAGCLQAYDLKFKTAGIKLFYEKSEDEIYVWGDESGIEEVFINYISNAVNHCSGAKEIHVKLNRHENRVRTEVFNTGERIPEESLERVWEKFYKVDKARTREYGGSGLGLSIVKAVMENMNGTYGVINYDDGVGFWFEMESK